MTIVGGGRRCRRHAGAAQGLVLLSVMLAAGCGEALGPLAPLAPDARVYPGETAGLHALRAALDSIRLRNYLPALGVALVTVDSAAVIAAVGTRSLGTSDLVSDADSWHLGSNTKAVLATHLQLLVDRGLLRWDAPLASVFPELASTMQPQFREATLADVAAHRAGLVREVSSTIQAIADPAAARARAVPEILRAEPVGPVGQHKYSNAGYVLLAAVADRALQRPWEQAVASDLLQPLGLGSAGFGPKAGTGNGQPWPHRPDGDGRLHAVSPGSADADLAPVLNSAGRLHLTLADWSRFVLLHLRGEAGEPDLLAAASIAQLHQPWGGILGDEGYAGGWFVHDDPWAGRILQHGGTNGLNFSLAWLAPGRGFAVLAVTNAGGDAAERGVVQAVEWVIRYQQAVIDARPAAQLTRGRR